ncbi:hypothetical protein BJX65DRAFT_195825 [Aspergillus insuetus]
MFATISYNKGDLGDDVWVMPASTHYFGERRQVRLACMECRAKKVKCTGEKTGCARCSTNRTKCVYPAPAERGSSGRKRTSSNTLPRSHTSSPSTSSASGKPPSISEQSSGTTTPHRMDPCPDLCQSSVPSATTYGGGSSTPVDSLLSSSLPLPSLDNPSFFPTLTDHEFFHLGSDDPSLNMLSVDENFRYGLDQLCTPSFPSLNELNLSVPQSRGSMTPSHPYSAPLPSTFTNTKNILFDIQAELGDTQQPCSCSEAAVHMLEELELKDYNDAELAADVVLNNQEASLGKFHAWLACERCPTPRATSMLLALILERLSLYFEKGVGHYARVLQGGGSPDISGSNSGSHRGDLHQQLPAGTGAVGEYLIKSRLEYGQVVRVLLTIQARKLASAIATLKQRNMLDGMLADTERRTRRIISELGSWEG